MSEREGNGRGTRQAWVACNTPPSRKNEGTERERKGNRKGTRREQSGNTA
jgi:hypothetical protein